MSNSIAARMVAVSNPREVWLITVAHAINELYSVALPPILPLLVNDFAISYGQAGILLTVFFAAYSVFQLPCGVLADRIGQRVILSAGMVVMAGGILLAAGAQDYRTLVIAETVAGIGGSTYHPSGMSLISDIEGGNTEGKAMGIHGFGGVAGTALAPALVGGLAAVYDWRVALTASAGVGGTYALAFFVLFHGDTGTDADPAVAYDGSTDPSGDGGSTTASSRHEWPSFASLVSVPVERWLGVLFVANLAIATEIGAVRTFVTAYLVEHAGKTTAVANLIFFGLLVGAGIASLSVGTLADTTDRRTLGFTVMMASTVALAVTDFVPPITAGLFAWFFLLGIVVYGAIPAMNAITSQYSERKFSGSLFGIMLTAGSLGGALGPFLFSVATEWFGLGTAFSLIAAVSVIGAVAFLALHRL